MAPGSTINGPTLTRGDVSGYRGSGLGAFSALPANLPVFGRVEKSLPIDAGGGDPQDQYQWVSRVDFSLSNNTQMYFRYAMQDQEAEPGTNSASPYDGYDTGYIEQEPQRARFTDPCLRPDLHESEQGRLEPAAQRPAAERGPPTDPIHEPDRRRCGCRASASVSQAICHSTPVARFPFGGPQSCCSSIRIRRGSTASMISASVVRSSISPTTAPSGRMPTLSSR